VAVLHEWERRSKMLRRSRSAAEEPFVVQDDESADGEWQVSWKVEEHLVD
jgi:hypothetical protein